jgi:hypothetical protein
MNSAGLLAAYSWEEIGAILKSPGSCRRSLGRRAGADQILTSLGSSRRAGIRKTGFFPARLKKMWTEASSIATIASLTVRSVYVRTLFLMPADTGKGEGLVLYLYNGLESAQHPVRLWTFQMHPRTSVDSIGQLIALDESFSSGGSVCEEILRTRWPGCRVDWLGRGPPSLD